MYRNHYSCALVFAFVLATELVAQTSTTTVLVVLENQPQQLFAKTQPFASAQLEAQAGANLLAARQAFAASVQQAVEDEQNQLEQILTTLGATNIVHHLAINALSATVPASAVNALQANPAVARVIPQTALNLFKLLDQTVTATANTTVSVTLDSGMSDDLARIVDGIVDRYWLTLVVRGPPSSLQNAITAAASADPSGAIAPDFVTSDNASLSNALAQVQSAGVFDPLAARALLINSADANAWNPLSGWGDVQPAAIASLAPCVNQSTANAANETSTCFIGSVAGQQSYSTTGTAPSKITLAWNRHINSDDTALLPHLSVHVTDKASGTEIASATSAGQNIEQLFASGNSGLTVRVQSDDPPQTGNGAEPYALVSSAPLTASSCQPGYFAFIPPTQVYPAAGGTQNFTVNNAAGCSWNIGYAPGDMYDFLQFDQSVHTGTGSIAMVAPPNTQNQTLTEAIVILLDGFLYTQFSVSQAAGTGSTCTFSASAGSLQFGYGGGAGNITVTPKPATCAYTVTSSAAWVTLNGSNGAFNVASNLQPNTSTQQRTATITVNGKNSSGAVIYTQAFTVTQSGLACTFTPPNSVPDIPWQGVPAQSFTMAISNAACQWSATSGSPDFVVVQNDSKVQSGTTAGVITYSASSPNNTSAPKNGFINAGGKTIDVKQDDNPTPPPPKDFDITVEVDLLDGTDTLPAIAVVVVDKDNKAQSPVKIAKAGTKVTIQVPQTGAPYSAHLTLTNQKDAEHFDSLPQNFVGLTPQNNVAKFTLYQLIAVKVQVASANGVKLSAVPLKFTNQNGAPPLPDAQTNSEGVWEGTVAKGTAAKPKYSVHAGTYTFRKNDLALSLPNVITFEGTQWAAQGTITLVGFNAPEAFGGMDPVAKQVWSSLTLTKDGVTQKDALAYSQDHKVYYFRYTIGGLTVGRSTTLAPQADAVSISPKNKTVQVNDYTANFTATQQ